MRDWKKEFENKFVADDILDCIPKKNWEEMRDEVFGFIEEEKEKSHEKGYNSKRSYWKIYYRKNKEKMTQRAKRYYQENKQRLKLKRIEKEKSLSKLNK